MNVSEFTVKRPILTLMVTLIVVILGGVAFLRLPVDLMPDIDYPMITVRTEYENTGPEIIEQLITRPIEQVLSAVPGVEDILSTSQEGVSQVRLAFTWGTNIEEATNDVRDRLERVLGRLPDEADRPRIFKFDYSAFPILFLGISGSVDPLYLRKMIDDQLAYRLERIAGVASVEVWGGDEREIQVNVFPEALKALNLPISQVVDQVQSGNVERPVGTMYRDSQQISMRTAGAYITPQDISRVVVAQRDGKPVLVDQVASVDDTVRRHTRIARINGKPGIRMAVSKQSGENTVTVARAVREEIDRINRDIPQISLVVLTDTSTYINQSIGNVGSSALYGGVISLVILVIVLRNLPSSIVIAVTIPISIIATFALMYFNKFTLNMMSLGGLALGVGMLVDNSIVVLENIYRLREEEKMPIRDAAVNGSGEVGSAVVASTLTTLIVFLPLIFVEGRMGVMFKQLAYIVSFSLMCSLGVALALVPTLAVRLRHATFDEARQGRGLVGAVFHLSGKCLDSLESMYHRVLVFSLAWPKTVLVVVFFLLVGTCCLIPFIGTEFVPKTDEGQVRVTGELEVGTRLEVTDEIFRTLIEPIVMKGVPEADSFVSNIGGSGGSAARTGNITINLKPIGQRSRSDEQIAEYLRRELAAVPGVTIRTRVGQGFFMMGLGGSNTESLAIEIRGYDLPTADALALQIREIVADVAGVTDTRLSRESGMPEEHFIVNREKAADLNVTVYQISTALNTIFAGTTAGTLRDGGSEYDIVVKVKDAENLGFDAISDLTVLNDSGLPIAISSVTDLVPTTGPMQIERKNQSRIVTVNVNISGRDIGSVAADIQERLKTIPIPRDFSPFEITGDYEEQQKSFLDLAGSVCLALVLTYMVMASLYESLKDPFVVMFSVPLAAIGVLVILFLTDTTFNIQTGIGVLMLGGIVVNNAIVLVDHIILLRKRDGFALVQAISESGRRRLRPILMTASTTCFALIPLAMALGEGSEMQAPMARTVIGGLASSTVITLLVVPVIYYLMERRGEAKRLNALAADKSSPKAG
ncbi:MAG: efflux RND transporter permease subunit [Spirochaetales bacterium]|jgi:HAE1 family hydrophobic/amphiphilic exporter-1|nr:efflux RND transporter permease subunit [Spirochaetales bacterium]